LLGQNVSEREAAVRDQPGVKQLSHFTPLARKGFIKTILIDAYHFLISRFSDNTCPEH
jgi:hypothetical protein